MQHQRWWYIVIGLLLVSPPFLLSQLQQQRPPAAKGSESSTLIRLKARFPLNVRKHYKLHHVTTVERSYRDGSTVQFRTQVDYFLSLRAVEVRDDGFITVSVNIDSLQYRYYDPEIQIEYNSEKDFPPPIHDWQFLWTTIPYGREWFQTYSPYGDIAHIQSPARQSLYQQLGDSLHPMDTIQKFLWYSAITDERLQFLGDITRNLLPQSLVAWNTEWFRPVLFSADKLLFRSQAAVQVTTSSKPDEYRISASADSLVPIRIQTLTPGYEDQFTSIAVQSGYQTHTLFLNRYGTVRRATGTLEAEILLTTKRGKTFTHKIHSTYTLQLLGQFQW